MEIPKDPKTIAVAVIVILFLFSFLTGQTCSLGEVPACEGGFP